MRHLDLTCCQSSDWVIVRIVTPKASLAEAGQNGTGSSPGTGPKAYLNWLVFDRNYSLVAGKSNFSRLTTAARETGQDVAHKKLSGTVTISEPGYIYVYLSNEEGMNPYEVYFDEFKVEHIKSPVVQMEDYYPFGLTCNEHRKENYILNQNKYNDKEFQDELDLAWLDYGSRMYFPELGRFFVQDRFTEKYFDATPYHYVVSNPINFVDINGDSIKAFFLDENGKQMSTVPAVVQTLFNNEFGIKIRYNADTEMLYFTRNFDSEFPRKRQ